MERWYEASKRRFSVRKYDPRPVEEEKLEKILLAGRVAPTACNFQPQRMLLITGQEALEKLSLCTRSRFGAPAAVLVCHDTTACWKRGSDGKASGDVDASIAATHVMMEAADLGLGSLWVMAFDPAAVREQFRVPEAWEPTAIIMVGYAAQDAQPAPMHADKLAAEKVVFRDSF